MKDFNIAKYLRENSLGSHAILGAYVDLHALKEEEVGNNKPVDEVPYVGAEEKLDGFGDEFDQVAPVEEAASAWEEKLNYYESEVNDLVYDMVDTTGADADQIADFFQYISTQIRNKSNFGSMEEEFQYDDDRDDVNPLPSLSPKYKGDYSNEQDKFDRMMDRAHEYIASVSPIVKKSIESLRADGFDDQDIIDFLATDFSNLEEEVSVSSSGVEMGEGANNEFSNVIKTLKDIAKEAKSKGAKLSIDDYSSNSAILLNLETKDGDYKLQKAIHGYVKKLVEKNNPNFKVTEIEQDGPHKISFSVDKLNVKSMKEAADFTKFVKIGNVYDNYHDATGGFRMKLKVTAVDPMNQIITAVDENGKERKYSAYQFTTDFRAEDPNPIDSKWTDPGYKNRD